MDPELSHPRRRGGGVDSQPPTHPPTHPPTQNLGKPRDPELSHPRRGGGVDSQPPTHPTSHQSSTQDTSIGNWKFQNFLKHMSSLSTVITSESHDEYGFSCQGHCAPWLKRRYEKMIHMTAHVGPLLVRASGLGTTRRLTVSKSRQGRSGREPAVQGTGAIYYMELCMVSQCGDSQTPVVYPPSAFPVWRP